MKSKLRFTIGLLGFLLFNITDVFSQDNPSTFTSIVVSPTQIEMSFTQNAATDDVLIAYNTSNTFGTPTGTYSLGNTITGGGTVVYLGDVSPFNHTSLIANTNYYYKIWSYDGSAYSTGIEGNATTLKWEPSYHPINFALSSKTHSTISLSWADAVGIVKPDGYLILASDIGFGSISNPIDGVEQSPSTLIKIANYGDQTVEFTGLTGNTTYYFKIFGYTNSGIYIDYKTDPTIPSVTITTEITPVAISLSGTVTEAAEDGELINVSIQNDDFVGSLTTTNWTVNNLPQGVTKGAITRTGNTTATIALAGNRTQDYDVDITNVEVIIDGAEFVLNSSAASANTGFTLDATDDAESLAILDDGSILEGSENGEVIIVNLIGGTFAATINSSNWTISNLPFGVSVINFVRNSATQIQFELSGNAVVDYDANINLTVSCDDTEVNDYSGADLSINTGVIFTANDDSETFTISAGTINEGAENTQTITVSLTGGTFANPLTASEWSLVGSPIGVVIGSVVRNSASSATITLSGNRTQDYDLDLEIDIEANASQINDHLTVLQSSNSVSFIANIETDPETLSITPISINEGDENGQIIEASVNYGTFATTLTPANWTITNLPTGVSVIDIDKTSPTTVEILLSGNRSLDYDVDITDFTVSVTAAEVDDYIGADLSANSGVTFVASDDQEIISLAWAATPGTNGAEATMNNEIISVTLAGGTFVSSEINTTNITLSGTGTTDAGISIESVTYVNPTTVSLALAWPATDYDVDIYLRVSIAQPAINIADSLIAKSIILAATVEPAAIILTDNTIAEGNESAGIITVTLTNDLFKIVNTNEPNDASNWVLTNLPVGVTKGNVTVTSTTTATISLLGNRTNDFDANITNISLNIEADEFVSANNSASASTGVVIISDNDNEVITISQATAINEGAENGKTIVLALAGGNWASTLTPANFTLNNAPTGVSVGAVAIDGSDPTKVNLTLSGNRSLDYDANITNMTVTVSTTELYDISSSITNTAGSITFTATAESATISHAGLTEANLDGAIINITLTNETFDDGTLNDLNFVLNNAPSGLSVASVAYNTSTTATLTLTFDETDFDMNYENFSITINAVELVGVGNLISNQLTIVATDDAESFTISAGTINEGVENSKTITVSLTGGTFSNTLTSSEWSLVGGPLGVTIGSVNRVNSTLASLTLSGNRTQDYDANLNVSVLANNSQINDNSSNLTSSNSVVFTVAVETDPETLTLSTKTINEGAENGQVITVVANHGTFATTLNPSNWTITNLPTGVTAGNPVKTTPTTATITLSGNRTIDYDVDITNFTVSVTDAEVDDYSGTDLSINTGITFVATNDQETISLAWAATPGSNGTEATMNNEIISVTLDGGTFVSSEINTTNITLSGTGTTDAGISIESVTYVNSTTIQLALAWNGTDYDVDKFIKVSLASAAYTQSDSLISKSIILPATDEPATIKIYNATVINEASENGNVIRIQLFDDVFEASLTPSNWTVNNLPTGVTMGSLTRLGDTAASIALVGNRTVDFDANISNVEVIILGAEFTVHSNDASDNNGFLITANNDVETLAISGYAIEGNEDIDSIVVTLSGGTWATLNKNNWTLNSGPTGVAIESVAIDGTDNSKVHLLLSGNRTVDYDANITNMTITVLAAELDDVTSGSIISATGFTFVASNETATISHAGLTELNLNNASITFTLSNETFVDYSTLVAGDFTLNNVPTGVTITSATGVSATEANLILAYDETDFDSDYSNFSITIAGGEVQSQGAITSNELTISHNIAELDEAIIVSWAASPGTNGGEATLDAEKIIITLSNGDFISGQVNTTNITATGTAVSEAGVTIQSVSYLTSTTVEVALAWNGTDFDVDKTLIINVNGNVYTDGSAVLTDEIDIIANVENLNASTTSLNYFGNILVGDNSSEQSFTLDGSNLLADVIVTPPTNFEISTTSGSGFDSTPINLSPTSGTLSSTTIYVRFSPTSSGSKSGNITIESQNAASKNVAVSGYGINSGAAANIIISEVADYFSSAAMDYIEIYNNGTAAVDITNWVITQRTTTDNSTEINLSLTAGIQQNTGGSNYMILEPGEYAVIVYSDYASLKSTHSIADDVAIFSNSVLPILNGNDRFQLSSPAKAVEDYFGDWDDYSTFSSLSTKAYERTLKNESGELESTWSTTSSTSYEYTPGGDNINPLPVELLSFTAQRKNDKISLNWITSSENNADYFSVEESYDAINFKVIGNQFAAGNSNILLNYSFLAELPSQNTVYYRLTTYDYDGSFGHSKIIEYTDSHFLEIGQPWSTGQNIIIPYLGSVDSEFWVELYDSKGVLIGSNRCKANNGQIIYNQNLPLVTGIYFIRLYVDGLSTTKKMFVF
jgi:trimeric autotransporter adhesin